jgi:membrane-associated phospholipid phosphatase
MMKINFKNEFRYFFDAAMRYFSFYGSFVFWVSAVILFYLFDQKLFATKFVIATLVAMAVEYFIKAMHRVKRPDFKKVKIYSQFQKLQEGGSFPSGHASNASLFATMLHLYYGMVPVTTFFVIATLCTGASRIYLKRHYARDVIAGYALGILAGFLTLYF